MEKVGDSHSSSREPVTATSNEMMTKPLRVLKVEAEFSEMCFEKIKGVLEKLDQATQEETHDIDTYYNQRKGTAIVLGSFDPEKLIMELENEAGDAIKSITDATESIHSGTDGTATAADEVETGTFGILRFPEMPVPEVADSRTEVLDHGEIERSQGSRRCCW